MKTKKQTGEHDADALRVGAGRSFRDARTGLRLRESPRRDFDHPLAKALGMVIREWRERHGFSAYEVAQRARISRQTLADTERAQVWFSVCLAARICDAMGLRFDDACAAAARLACRFSEKKRLLQRQ